MLTYSEIQQKLAEIESKTNDAVVAITSAANVTDEMRDALTFAMSEGTKFRVMLSQFLVREAKSFAHRISLDSIDVLYRGRSYSAGLEGYVYYEKCPVVERKANYLTVESQNLSVPGFYKGGRFRLKREELQQEGMTYHSRHGDYFYLAPLSDSSPLPGSVVMCGVQPRSHDLVLGTSHLARHEVRA